MESFNLLDHGVAKYITRTNRTYIGSERERVECAMLDSTYHLIDWMKTKKIVQKCATKQQPRNSTHWRWMQQKNTNHLIKQPVYYVLNKFTMPMIIFKNLFEWDEMSTTVFVSVCQCVCVCGCTRGSEIEGDTEQQGHDTQLECNYTYKLHSAAPRTAAAAGVNLHKMIIWASLRCNRTHERTNKRQTFRRTKQTNGRHTHSLSPTRTHFPRNTHYGREWSRAEQWERAKSV